MLYKEKIIQGLECCMSESRCYKCPYTIEAECENGTSYYSKAIEDAITLLKEPKSMEPTKVQEGNRTDYFCRNCTTKVGMLFSDEDAWRFHYYFCPYCGWKVKWNEGNKMVV